MPGPCSPLPSTTSADTAKTKITTSTSATTSITTHPKFVAITIPPNVEYSHDHDHRTNRGGHYSSGSIGGGGGTYVGRSFFFGVSGSRGLDGRGADSGVAIASTAIAAKSTTTVSMPTIMMITTTSSDTTTVTSATSIIANFSPANTCPPGCFKSTGECVPCGSSAAYCLNGVAKKVSPGYYSTGGTHTTRTGQSKCGGNGFYCVDGVRKRALKTQYTTGGTPLTRTGVAKCKAIQHCATPVQCSWRNNPKCLKCSDPYKRVEGRVDTCVCKDKVFVAMAHSDNCAVLTGLLDV